MNFRELANFIFKKLEPILENHLGLFIFAKERAKFEGWLKVELCNIISKKYKNVVPENKRVDITFSDWAIELKTVNTNYRYKDVKNKTRPITLNINNILEDIQKLKKSKFKNKGILFIVFPLSLVIHKRWLKHLNRIKEKISDIKFCSIHFKNKISAVIYFGKI